MTKAAMPFDSLKHQITELLDANSLTPNKALGQNFLIDSAALSAIIDAADADGRAVLEIGPGPGTLTQFLLERAKKTAVVEIDRNMAEILEKRFGNDIILYREDFLKSDIGDIYKALGEESLCVVGNLPYYITTPICMRLLKSTGMIHSMTLMVQEEAAQRFFASPGSRVYGPLSILSQAFYDVKSVIRLSPSSYFPQPEVCSEVIRLSRNSQPFIEALPSLLQNAFRMRRKTLVNNLKPLYPDARAVASVLQSCGFASDIRAEALSPADYICLFDALSDISR